MLLHTLAEFLFGGPGVAVVVGDCAGVLGAEAALQRLPATALGSSTSGVEEDGQADEGHGDDHGDDHDWLFRRSVRTLVCFIAVDSCRLIGRSGLPGGVRPTWAPPGALMVRA
ncbi:hypothetical protein [Streptomyces canus]|uniref:hypothetical protein n=1 Tax=Streptomyces canus TaxID=58343 RepID=UPI002DD98A10|nr:hypothetical protein [Streptomyces canus]